MPRFKTMRGGILAALLLCSAGVPARADDAAALAKILTGGYDTARAVAEESAAGPVETLQVTPIWTKRDDGPWLYVEGGSMASPDRPDRQEIWQLKFQPHKGGTEIRRHLLPKPELAVGAWRRPDKLRTVLPETLKRVDGCELVLQRRQEFVFSGGTPGMECRPPGSEAAYALIQANVEPEGITWWAREFNDGGQRIAGPETGGVRYDKVAIGDVSLSP